MAVPYKFYFAQHCVLGAFWRPRPLVKDCETTAYILNCACFQSNEGTIENENAAPGKHFKSVGKLCETDDMCIMIAK